MNKDYYIELLEERIADINALLDDVITEPCHCEECHECEDECCDCCEERDDFCECCEASFLDTIDELEEKNEYLADRLDEAEDYIDCLEQEHVELKEEIDLDNKLLAGYRELVKQYEAKIKSLEEAYDLEVDSIIEERGAYLDKINALTDDNRVILECLTKLTKVGK